MTADLATCAGFCTALLRAAAAATDVDWASFLTLGIFALIVDGFVSSLHAVVLVFQIAPIFDWTTLPLYTPSFDGAVAGGAGTSSIILLSFPACSPRTVRLRASCFPVAAASRPSFMNVFTLF